MSLSATLDREVATGEPKAKPASLSKAWRFVGIAGMVVSAIAGMILVGQGARWSLYGNDEAVAIGLALLVASPLSLLVPFTIAQAIDRSERIEAALTRLAEKA